MRNGKGIYACIVFMYFIILFYFYQTIPRSFLELIPDAGHMAMLESPEHLIHMVGCFLDMWT